MTQSVLVCLSAENALCTPRVIASVERFEKPDFHNRRSLTCGYVN
jgi:hypothetical protein